MRKYETNQFKTKQVSFEKLADTDAKQMITDATPTVMHKINARWRAKKYQEYSYPGENVLA